MTEYDIRVVIRDLHNMMTSEEIKANDAEYLMSEIYHSNNAFSLRIAIELLEKMRDDSESE